MDHVNGQLEDVIVHFRVHFLDRALARAGPYPPSRCGEQAACPGVSRVCAAPLPRTQAQQDAACSATHCRTCLPLASRFSSRVQASPRNLGAGVEREQHGCSASARPLTPSPAGRSSTSRNASASSAAPIRGRACAAFHREARARPRRGASPPGGLRLHRRGAVDRDPTHRVEAAYVPRCKSGTRPTFIPRGQAHRGARPGMAMGSGVQDPSHKPLDAEARLPALAG
jgi:hypothetical protein